MTINFKKQFCRLEDLIQQPKANFIKYPRLSDVIDREIRVKISNRPLMPQSSRFSIKSYATSLILSFKKKLTTQYKVSSSPNIYLNIGKFEHLIPHFISCFEKDGYKILQEPDKFGIALTNIEKRNVRLTTLLNVYPVQNFTADLHKAPYLPTSRKRCEQLEADISSQVQMLVKHIIANNIKLMITTGDSSIRMSILRQAANLADVPFFVICHGFIQDPELITILPLRANRLFVWTKKEQDMLRQIALPEQAKKILYAGFLGKTFPRPSDLSQKKNLQNCLFILEPLKLIYHFNNEDNLIAALRMLSSSFNVLLRIHPSNDVSEFTDILSEVDVAISNKSLDQDIKDACFVVGTNSAV